MCFKFLALVDYREKVVDYLFSVFESSAGIAGTDGIFGIHVCTHLGELKLLGGVWSRSLIKGKGQIYEKNSL